MANTARDLGRRMMTQALVVLSMCAVIVYFIYSGNVQLDDPVSLKVELTQGTPTTPGGEIPLTVDITFANNTDKGMALTAPTQCDVFNWFVTGTDKEFVQAKNDPADCPKQAVTTWLDSKHQMKETFKVGLDPKRVHPGDYLFFVRYWGHESIENLKIK